MRTLIATFRPEGGVLSGREGKTTAEGLVRCFAQTNSVSGLEACAVSLQNFSGSLKGAKVSHPFKQLRIRALGQGGKKNDRMQL